jgi:signal transduction histidine kinase
VSSSFLRHYDETKTLSYAIPLISPTWSDGIQYGYSVITSLFFVYLSHIFITIGLIMLTIAKRRNQLISESRKHKKLEKSLVETLEKAQLANNEKDLFLINMSHELRTPLNAILGFSESLKLDYYGNLNKKQLEYIDNIHSGGEFLLKLITDLLHLSNIQEGKVEITPTNINLFHLIDKTTPLLNEIVGQINVSLDIESNIDQNKTTSASVYVDQIRVAQVLINFVSNAVKYGDRTSDIKLSLDEIDDCFFRLSVTNKGKEIMPDQYDNIFKPFNRADADEKKIDGVGVGLSIAKQLIEDMNGTIGFSSKIDEGSVFWIDIPKSEQRQLI